MKKVKSYKRKKVSVKNESTEQDEEESDLKKYMIELLILKYNRRY